MSKIILALGAAALAISAPALADKEGKGQGGGNKGGQQQKAERGGGGKDRGNQAVKLERGDRGPAVAFGNGRGKDDFRKAEKGRGNDRKDDNVRIVDRRDRDFDRDDNVRVIARNFGGFNGGFDNCPPGLAKKDNGCLPPGQAKKYLGSRIQQAYLDSRVPYQYRSWYRDDDSHFFRYGDDYIYRVSRTNNLIDGIIPLFGGGGYYTIGDRWPDSYDFYNVPYQYRDYYADSSDYRYRYGDGAIYRINSGSGFVDGIVALLAGDLGVGSRLPAGYDTYNVPFAYRDRYYDSADNWYRYNDGYIYQVDPKTRLVSAVIDALV